MKLIFLDIDGVLNRRGSAVCELGYIGIDEDKLHRLGKIIEATNAQVVLTSTWKLHWEKDVAKCDRSALYLNKKFEQIGACLLDKTKDNGSDRGVGIQKWIADCEEPIENWIIIDDEWFDYKELGISSKVIKTTFYGENGGLQDSHIELAIELLNSEDKNMINDFSKDYFFLSNFYNAYLMYEGVIYCSTEAAFQAAKTLDVTERERIARLSPSDAKKAGRKLELRSDWEEVKDKVMYDVCRAKFTMNSSLKLKERLLATGDKELVEGNTWHDNYWGNCTCDKCKDIPGRNQLGKTLMRLRDELRNDG